MCLGQSLAVFLTVPHTMINGDIQTLIWRSYFTHHVLKDVPYCRVSPEVMQAFEQLKDRTWYKYREYYVTTRTELLPAPKWVPPCLLQGGSWYEIGSMRDGSEDGMDVGIYVHGTSGALAYYDDGGITSATIKVCDFDIYDLACDGFHPEWESFSLSLYSFEFCVDLLRHHLKHHIGNEHWMDIRKPEHVPVDRPGKAWWQRQREHELWVTEWKREKREEQALLANSAQKATRKAVETPDCSFLDRWHLAGQLSYVCDPEWLSEMQGVP